MADAHRLQRGARAQAQGAARDRPVGGRSHAGTQRANHRVSDHEPGHQPRARGGPAFQRMMPRREEGAMNAGVLSAAASLLGRILLVAIFLPEAWVKIRGYDGVVAYMEDHDVPGVLLPLVILVEVVGPILIGIG